MRAAPAPAGVRRFAMTGCAESPPGSPRPVATYAVEACSPDAFAYRDISSEVARECRVQAAPAGALKRLPSDAATMAHVVPHETVASLSPPRSATRLGCAAEMPGVSDAFETPLPPAVDSPWSLLQDQSVTFSAAKFLRRAVGAVQKCTIPPARCMRNDPHCCSRAWPWPPRSRGTKQGKTSC